MDANTFNTHTIYVDYPLDTQHLKEMSEDINSLNIAMGDLVIVDCEGMSYICSSGFRVFLELHKKLTQKDSKMIIRHLHPLVKKVFGMSGFTQILNIEE